MKADDRPLRIDGPQMRERLGTRLGRQLMAVALIGLGCDVKAVIVPGLVVDARMKVGSTEGGQRDRKIRELGAERLGVLSANGSLRLLVLDLGIDKRERRIESLDRLGERTVRGGYARRASRSGRSGR